MASIGRNLLLRLHVKRRALLRHYDDNALHQLRVALRRLRSLLRHVDTQRAGELRHSLGQLADATNAARDWDTLLLRARESLRPREFRRVQPILQQHRAESHGPVLEMLRSAAWAQAVDELGCFIEQGGLVTAGATATGAEITRAKDEVRRAWCKVQAEDDNKHWHKLRLAIKELRYTFDSAPRDSLSAPMPKTLRHCKRLQETLGAWHDTVVHLHSVRELAMGLDSAAESELHDMLKRWCKRMEREGRNALAEARDFLAGKGADLLQ
jgi:CHAD domain-containing protein